MKVVTYNIRFGMGLDKRFDLGRIADAVRDADIIGLQEVERYWRRSGMVDQPQVLGELLKEFYWAYCPAFDMDASIMLKDGSISNRRRQFGPMLLSRWPILSVRSLVLPQLSTVDLISMSTGAIEGVIDSPCGPLRVYSVHLSPISPQERLMQIDALLEMHNMIVRCGRIVVADGMPNHPAEAAHITQMDWSNGEPSLPIPVHTIYLGDFNCTEESSEYIRFASEPDPIYGRGMHSGSLVDSWSIAREKFGEPVSWWPDPPNRLPRKPLRLDYCFINAELAPKVSRAWVDVDATGSDHKPYWVELGA